MRSQQKAKSRKDAAAGRPLQTIVRRERPVISDFYRFGLAGETSIREKALLLYLYRQDDVSSRQMLPLLSEVANIFGDHLDVATLEAGACRNLSDIYRDGDALPELLLVVDGVPLGRLTGARRRREIAAFLSRHVAQTR